MRAASTGTSTRPLPSSPQTYQGDQRANIGLRSQLTRRQVPTSTTSQPSGRALSAERPPKRQTSLAPRSIRWGSCTMGAYRRTGEARRAAHLTRPTASTRSSRPGAARGHLKRRSNSSRCRYTSTTRTTPTTSTLWTTTLISSQFSRTLHHREPSTPRVPPLSSRTLSLISQRKSSTRTCR